MNNQVKLLDLNAEFRRQSRRYLKRIRELALGGISAGLLLLAHSHTTFPAAHVTEVLLEKLGTTIARPDGRFLLAAIASCCVALIFTFGARAAPVVRTVVSGIPPSNRDCVEFLLIF